MVEFKANTKEDNMQVITYEEFANLLRGLKTCPTATIVTETDLSDYQYTDSPYLNKLKKVAQYTVVLGGSYEDAMKEKNKNFIIKENKWGTHVNNIIVEHKGKLYVSLLIQKKHFSFLKVGKDRVTPETYKLIKAYLKPLEEPNPVGYRRFKIYSIKYITIKNQTYMVI